MIFWIFLRIELRKRKSALKASLIRGLFGFFM